MKLGDKVGIVCDHTLTEEAKALRGLLESFKLDVDLHRLTQCWQAEEFFAKRAAAYDYVILQCHGCEKPCLQIKIEVIKPKKSNPELGDMVVYQLTPENIPDKLKGFKGVFVSRACESGRPEMGTAFLKAGCKAYLGPSDYSDGSSGTMFIASFFHFLSTNGVCLTHRSGASAKPTKLPVISIPEQSSARRYGGSTSISSGGRVVRYSARP